MKAQSAWGKRLIYTLIFLSGMAGLIYQVVWHKYLSILLGAQARATAVVLAIFLGGISAGYAVFGRWSRWKPWNLLLAYVLVELLLAVWAICFPHFFRAMMPLTPKLYAFFGVESLWIDILMSVVLIGFPTFLMGGTLPLLTQGLSEDLKNASSTHARIYGFNTVGGCFGSLVAGYILVPMTDLPVTVTVAGMLNVLVACVAYFAFARNASAQKVAKASSNRSRVKSMLSTSMLILFGVGFLSGFYVITLETVLIRLMGLSTGSSNYNFTLIVSIFVFALGFGSLIVRKISGYTLAHLFWNQVGVSCFLVLLYLSGDYWSYWVHLIRVVFRDNIENFYLYQSALGVFFLCLLAIPIGLCGLTLPLCFHLIKDKQETLGYRVGQLYSLNTVGCVLGALLGGYGLLNYVNLDVLFKICVATALFSTALAGYGFISAMKPTSWQLSVGGLALGTALVTLLVAPLYDKAQFVQPFRRTSPGTATYEGKAAWTKELSGNTEYVVYRDGPNSSVGIGHTMSNGQERSRTIFVNGKSDGNTSGDLLTMSLTGHIPGLLAPKLDRACVIGFGTGITIGALARYSEAKEIHVAEIASTILENAREFDVYNGGVSTNPKIRFHQMDAFRYLGGTKEKFDVIVSEPSNPWVAGVENLYSSEFYAIARKKLNPDGMFVQWMQTYSFNESLVRMVFKTITEQFPYVTVFQMLDHDVAMVAMSRPFTPADLERAAERFSKNASARRMLQESGINRIETVLAYEMVPASLAPVIGAEADVHRLEAPRLSHRAAKAFFVNSSVRMHSLRKTFKEFYPAIRKSLLSMYLRGESPDRDLVESFRQTFCESAGAKSRNFCEEVIVMAKWLNPKLPYEVTYSEVLPQAESRSLASLGEKNSKRKQFTREDLGQVQKLFDFYKRYYSSIAPIPIQPVVNRLKNCLNLVDRDTELYGDCLLQKTAVLEIAEPESAAFPPSIRAFQEWFGRLPRESQHYGRFKRASEIMDRLLEETKNRSAG